MIISAFSPYFRYVFNISRLFLLPIHLTQIEVRNIIFHYPILATSPYYFSISAQTSMCTNSTKPANISPNIYPHHTHPVPTRPMPI